MEIKKENSEDKQNVKFATEVNSDLFSATSKPAEVSFKKAVYKKPNHLEIAKLNGKRLTPAQQALLFNILTANEVVFKGGRGHNNRVPVGLKLKDNAKPFCIKPYPIPLKNSEVMEHDLGQQCLIGALGCLMPKEFEVCGWDFPALGTPKKNGTVRFVVDFNCINQNLVCCKFPLCTTEEILTLVKCFLYFMSIDLNMGYPLIPLNDKARKILTIIMPFGAYKCLTSPMGVMLASDLFQSRMVHMFADMNKRRPFTYIDNILHFKGMTFEEHIAVLDEILQLIQKSRLQVSAKKSRFCQESVKYLGFQLSRMGYQPLLSHVSAILRINAPETSSKSASFLD